MQLSASISGNNIFIMQKSMDWTATNFDWNRARAFLVTAEEGSFSAAARALGTTQPTLGRQVTSLEDELGVALFERVGNALELTDSGVQLLEHVRRMGESAVAFSLTARGQAQTLQGSVVISASEVDAYFRLPPILAKLRAQEPGIDIEIVVSNEASDLKRREADIALRSFRPTQQDLIARKVLDDDIWLYGSSTMIDSFSDQSPAEVQDLQLLGWDRNHQIEDLLNQQGWQLTSANFAIHTQSHLLQLALVKQGLGLSFLPEKIGASISGIKRAFVNQGPIMQLPLWLVSHRELRTSARVRRVFDLLADELTVH